MTPEQKQFMLSLLRGLTINPSSQDAAKTVELVQGIIKSLEEDKLP